MSQAQNYLNDTAQSADIHTLPPCGNESIHLYFGLRHYLFTGLSLAQKHEAMIRFACIAAPSDSTPHDRAEATVLALHSAPSHWFKECPKERFEYQIAVHYEKHSIGVAGLSFVAEIERSPNQTHHLAVDEHASTWFIGAFENVFRIICCYHILSRGGLVVHSAGVATGKYARLFFGPSGAGKTTLTRLCYTAGKTTLSDDLNALLPSEKGWQLIPMPFAGDFGQHCKDFSPYILSNIYRIKQSPEVWLTTLPRHIGAASLSAACPFINADPWANQHLLKNIAELIQKHTINLLGFAKNLTFWHTLNHAQPNNLLHPRHP